MEFSSGDDNTLSKIIMSCRSFSMHIFECISDFRFTLPLSLHAASLRGWSTLTISA